MWYKISQQNTIDYPEAGEETSNLSVDSEEIPNMSSIEASLIDYRILPGIKELPLSEFEPTDPRKMFCTADDIRRCQSLAEQIKENRYIKPLIVVIDKDGPYILEGIHRLGALHLLGATTFPAKIVIDDEEN
jgi:hypothetical protein